MTPYERAIHDKLTALRTTADGAHPNTTRGIIDALCVVSELLLHLIMTIERKGKK